MENPLDLSLYVKPNGDPNIFHVASGVKTFVILAFDEKVKDFKVISNIDMKGKLLGFYAEALAEYVAKNCEGCVEKTDKQTIYFSSPEEGKAFVEKMKQAGIPIREEKP